MGIFILFSVGEISESTAYSEGSTGSKAEVDDFDQLFAWVLFAVDQSRYSGGVHNNVHMLMCTLMYITFGGVWLPV